VSADQSRDMSNILTAAMTSPSLQMSAANTYEFYYYYTVISTVISSTSSSSNTSTL